MAVHDDGLGEWIAELYSQPEMLLMGHNQRADDLNLGLGWLYYALGRLLHPARVVVIGSYRGFAPLVLAKALSDNVEDGSVVFIDPSMVDEFWTEPAAVQQHFAALGATNIEHHQMTTQEFVTTETYSTLGEIGLLFVDGYHSAEQARFDYEAFRDRLTPRSFVLFHDSMSERESTIYGSDKKYTLSVRRFIDELKGDASLQVLDVPFGTGLTMVRKTTGHDMPLTEGMPARPDHPPPNP
jgi:predicted O-methyltransferase YrrM